MKQKKSNKLTIQGEVLGFLADCVNRKKTKKRKNNVKEE